MFRSFFIYLSSAGWARKIVTGWSFAWKMASRFVAGVTLQDGIQAIKLLNSKGINATLDHLGEHTDSAEQANQATQDILQAFDAIEQAGLRANVSVKLTQIGLGIGSDVCLENLVQIAEKAKSHHNFFRIDMEDSTTTQRTLDLLRALRQRGYDNAGIVIQSYLYRTEADIRQLLSDGFKIRLCKGAYKEPAKIAYQKMKDVDANYDRCAVLILDDAKAKNSSVISPDGKIPPVPCMATHDPRRIEYIKEYMTKIGLSKEAVEFQMLNGIRRDLQDQLVKEGFKVRVYVPYGTEWYPYFLRRIAERPADLLFLLPAFNFK